jgi:fused signal recognition particle receptor
VAFFKKLKERMFKSSSKIDEGLEAIVSDGGGVEAVESADQIAARAQAEVIESAAHETTLLQEAAQQEVNRLERAAEAVALAETVRLEREAVEQAAIEKQAQDIARIEAEAAAAKNAEEKRTAEAAATKLAEENRIAQAARVAAQEARLAEEHAAAEVAAAQEKAEQVAVPAAEPLRTTLTPVAPDLAEIAAAPAAKPGFLGRLMGRTTPQTIVRRTLDDDMLEQLEELLISADMGVDTALRVTANMAEGRFGKKLSVDEIKDLMATEIARIMEPVARPLPLYPKTPQVVLVVGVNGSGKTTTIGKLASQFKAAGKNVVIAAGDTFRAAAVEQLQVWGERAGVPVLTAAQGSDPASLAFDAMTKAESDGADLLLIDTAGRLQNRSDLMEELAKIVRVIRKKDPSAPHNTLLVLDATTGQNALNQVKVFQDISDVSGLVMTKLDGTAKGGVLVALADKFGLPIHAIGVGEQIDDLQAFDPQEFADALVGYER